MDLIRELVPVNPESSIVVKFKGAPGHYTPTAVTTVEQQRGQPDGIVIECEPAFKETAVHKLVAAVIAGAEKFGEEFVKAVAHYVDHQFVFEAFEELAEYLKETIGVEPERECVISTAIGLIEKTLDENRGEEAEDKKSSDEG
jgi:hypothetical protein